MPSQRHEIAGTSYAVDTAPEVVRILEDSRLRRKRIAITYGDVKTGRAWDDRPERGHVGRSTGSEKIPLLIKTKTSSGGGGILDNCIVLITESPGGRVLYDVRRHLKPLDVQVHKGRVGEHVRRDPRRSARKTRDLYVIQGNYGYGHGWEDLTAAETRKEAKSLLKDYRENEPSTPTRLVHKMERIQLRLPGVRDPAPKKGKRDSSHRRRDALKPCPVGTQVQTLLLDKSYFDARDARGWAKRHGFHASKLDVTENHYRFRQAPPSAFDPQGFRTMKLRPGVQAVVGCPR